MTGRNSLTVRLLVTGAGTGTAEFLGLHAPVVGNEEGAVVGDEGLLELVLAVLVDVLLVVGDLWAGLWLVYVGCCRMFSWRVAKSSLGSRNRYGYG